MPVLKLRRNISVLGKTMPFLIIHARVVIENKIAKKLAIYYIIRLRQCQMNLKKKDALAHIDIMLYHIGMRLSKGEKLDAKC